MSLTFLFGRSGYGKTTNCINNIKKAQETDESHALIYIVPEQFSLQSEKDLLDALGEMGLMRAQVLSFKRLAYSVFSQTGRSEYALLEDIGKNMLLRKVLIDIKKDLSFFKGTLEKQGFIEKLSSTITEFYQYSVEPENLLSAISNMNTNENLKMKMTDIYTIYSEYKKYLENNYISTDETLDILSEKIPQSNIIRDSEIWIDGFKSFTPQELKVIEQLMIYSSKITIALTIENVDVEFHNGFQSNAFFDSESTINKLIQVAKINNIKIEPAVYLKQNSRYASCDELKFLEANYFNNKFKPYSGLCNNVKIIYADNKYDEIHYAAKEIINLVMKREYKYNEIAVVSCSASDYDAIIKSVFSQYDIPVFVDTKKDILSHPLVELIRAALDIIANDWQYENVFRFLKTNMLNISRENTDLLENYVIAYGIRYNKWQKQWTYGFEGNYEKFDFEQLNSLRQNVLSMLSPLTEKLTKSKKYSVHEISTTLIEFLNISQVTDKLSEWADLSNLENDISISKEHIQIWSKVIDVVDKMVEILGDEKVTVSTYNKILEAGFLNTDIGITPPCVDQIIFGDLRRSRLPKIKALFLIGANEGALPAKINDSGLFSDDERLIISAQDIIELAGSGLSKAYEEEFLLYAALSKPSEFLNLSCYLGGLDGKSLRPSMAISKIKEILPKVDILNLSQVSKEPDYNVSTAKSTFNTFTGEIRNFTLDGVIPEVYKDVYAYFVRDSHYSEKLKAIELLLSNSYENEVLSNESIEKVYGKSLKASISKLEKYVQCPFSYFMQYNLNAKERKIYEVENIDLGNIFHSVLDTFAHYLKIEKVAWEQLSDKQMQYYAEKSIDEALDSDKYEIMKSTGRYNYFSKRLKDMSMKSIWALTEHMKNGKFELFSTEISFSANEHNEYSSDLGAFYIGLDEEKEMQLYGRIDRIDFLNTQDEGFVKIIDYKSGNKEFRFADVYYGLQLQLVIYMDAFIKKYEEKTNFKHKLNPAAVFYFSVINPIIEYKKELIEEENRQDIIDTEILKKYKMSGVSVSDEQIVSALDRNASKKSEIFQTTNLLSMENYKKLMEFAIEKAKKVGTEILSGNISATPYLYKKNSGCTYCSYKNVCQFEPIQNVNRYKKMKNIKEQDAINAIMNLL